MWHSARWGIRPGLLPLLLLALGACSPRPARSAPEPVAAAAPEVLGESADAVREAAHAVTRDLLGTAAYDLPLVANSWVEAELDFLVEQRREVIGRWLERGDFFEPHIKRVLAERGVPSDLYHLAMIESGFIPTARSHAGAVGLWQFMPATARMMGLRVDSVVDERMDPIRSTDAAARHLKTLYGVYNDWALAAAAYNAGSGRISRGLQKFDVSNYWELAAFGDLATETKHYVPRLYATTIIARDRERFGFAPALAASAYGIDSVALEYATPLRELARIGEISSEALARLNPHLIRQTAPADYLVWVPAGTGERVQQAYLASDFRAQQGLGSYTVRPGDHLGKLAELSGTSRARIRELNPAVDFDRLKSGQKLRMPFAAAQALGARAPEPLVVASAPSAPAAARGPLSTTKAQPAVEHRVAQGETLWGIARSYGVSVAEIERANALGSATIRTGQTLKIPATAATATPQVAAKTVEHIVRTGETLWGIARQYGCTIDSIQSANHLAGASIVPGQKLMIPQKGE